MDPVSTNFESFEQQFSEVVAEVQLIMNSEANLRDATRSEAARAEAAEAAAAAAMREAADSQASATAAAAGASYASTALAAAQEELTKLKSKLEITERRCTLLEEKCCELTERAGALDREIQQLRPSQSVHTVIQRQYVELEGRIHNAIEEACSEASRLEEELRRVEKCARGGMEVRERARLAAAAHARERRCAAEDLQHKTLELQRANAEIVRLGALISELQHHLSEYSKDGISKTKCEIINDLDSLVEIRAALEVERAGADKIERALATALTDNAVLAAELHKSDNPVLNPTSPPIESKVSNIDPIDSFLAD